MPTVTPAQPPSKRQGQNLIAAISIGLFIFSLALPAIDLGVFGAKELGFHWLLIGWLGPLDSHFEWFANPFLFVSVLGLFTRSFALAIACGTVAVGLILLLMFSGPLIMDEAGHQAVIKGYLIGYWLWLGSAVVCVGGAAWCLYFSSRERNF